MFFFFKQKTAYEMRISDWSSDVCSSDLLPAESSNRAAAEQAALAAILALKKEHQILKVRTILGPKDIPAPADFDFDTTGTIVWIKLVHLAREAKLPIKIHQARYVLEGQMAVLALVLSNSLGFTTWYWMKAANEFAERR